MADSPAKRHLARQLAAKAAAAAAPDQLMDGAGIYEETMLQLVSDKRRLKQIQSAAMKGQAKAAMLPAYRPYIEGVLSQGRGARDDIITTLMLWSMDAGDYPAALEIAAYVLQHDLPMADSFQRTTGCVVAEEIADAALNAQKTSVAFDQAVLDTAAQLTEGKDMPDQVRAKLLLARARGAFAKGEPTAEALQHVVDDLRTAIQLHDSCGGKEDLKRAERLLNKLTDSQPTG